jgi:hypothetical protein
MMIIPQNSLDQPGMEQFTARRTRASSSRFGRRQPPPFSPVGYDLQGSFATKRQCSYGGVNVDKHKVQAVLDSFGGDVDVDALLERLAVLDDIERGERQLAAGEVVPHDVVRERIERICR